MSEEQFMTAYQRFCTNQGFPRQADYAAVSEILDFLILITIAGPFARLHSLRPGQNADQEEIRQATDFWRNWQVIDPTARTLIKQGFHVMNGLADMTDRSLAQCRMYYDWRGSKLPDEQEKLRKKHTRGERN